MKGRSETKRKNRRSKRNLLRAVLIILPLFFAVGCNELEKPKPEPFYAQTAPPPNREFRWSNGKMPKSFDPAKAAAPPETDIVRAIFEGLTDIDAKTLAVVPALAVKWTPSEDFKTWTFTLRRDAKWSNGETVTARDFVESWQRLAEAGEKIPQKNLLQNIVGMNTEKILPVFAETVNANANVNVNAAPNRRAPESNVNFNSAPTNSSLLSSVAEKIAEKEKNRFGAEAVDDFTLKISLINADRDFPALVAHPVFRPVFAGGKDFKNGELNAAIVTNGAFRIASVGRDGVTLDRSDSYWNRGIIKLDRVRFVPTENAETALQSYRAGELDAVTNADFEPLALKLLTPFEDFRQTPHGAINFYQFNPNSKPFDDRRVREALTIAFERERLTEADTDGATEPALNYSPFRPPKIVQDVERARTLLAEAGFPDGEDFPVVKLLINRNDLQRRVARSVAKMWEKNLNIKTEIIVKDGEEFNSAAENGEYDLIRRNAVLPTTDETVNVAEILPPQLPDAEKNEAAAEPIAKTETNSNVAPKNENANITPVESKKIIAENLKTAPTADEAIVELPAVPLYFPTSSSLVKPYVRGFELNALDAPSLKTVEIDNDWQPKTGETKTNR